MGGQGKIKENISTPRAIPGLQKVQKIFAADAHNFVITDEKRVYTWGLNKYGQCAFLSEGMAKEGEAYQISPRLLQHLRGVDEIIVAGNCAAGFSLFLINELKYLLWQHIRDLNLTQVQRILLSCNLQTFKETDEKGLTALH